MTSIDKEKIDATESNPKVKFRALASKTLPVSNLDSDMIYFTQLHSLNTISKDNNDLEKIRQCILEKITT